MRKHTTAVKNIQSLIERVETKQEYYHVLGYLNSALDYGVISNDEFYAYRFALGMVAEKLMIF